MLLAANANIGSRLTDSRHVTLTQREKVEIVEQVIEWMADTGLSLTHAAEILKVSRTNLSRWMRELPVLKKKSVSPSSPWTCHPGRTSQLAPVHDELLFFVEEYWCAGFVISKRMLIFQAARLSEEESFFFRNTKVGKVHAITRWMERNNLVLRAGTHQAQEPPEHTMSAAKDYIFHMACPAVQLSYRNKWYIINMDQTPVFFSYMQRVPLRQRARVLSMFGLRKMDLSVSPSLSPSLLLDRSFRLSSSSKGKRAIRIIRRELATYPRKAFYATQDKIKHG